MSRRTAESNKAILAAWDKERELVQAGKGTREWTPHQQQDILDKGKAYDDDGFAFQGQHMKSAEQYPEYQGEPGNIQFLTRAEHLEAHNGNWRNPTNWYYNPSTKEMVDFGEGPFIPCTVIPLPEPVVKLNSISGDEEIEPRDKVETGQVTVKTGNIEPKSLSDIIREGEKRIYELSHRHPWLPRLISTAKKVAKAAAIYEGTRLIKKAFSSVNSPISKNGKLGADDDCDYGGFPSDELKESGDDYWENDYDTKELNRPYTPNDVPVGKQRYHTKKGIEWREKPSYHREGNNDR